MGMMGLAVDMIGLTDVNTGVGDTGCVAENKLIYFHFDIFNSSRTHIEFTDTVYIVPVLGN
jgi:hypothetical protein